MSALSTAPPSLLFLPEHVQLNVFSHLPLLDLLHIDEVCRPWGRLKLVALSRRKHLYIVNQRDDLKKLEAPESSAEVLRYVMEDDGKTPYVKPKLNLDRHAFYTKVLTSTQLDKIVDLLPNLKVLRLIRTEEGYFALWKIKYLLNCYRSQLVEFTLSFLNTEEGENAQHPEEDTDFVCDRFHELATSMLHSLNSLPNLRSLELNLETPNGFLVPVEVDLPIASRLKTLKIRTFGFSDGTVDDSQTVLQSLLNRRDLNEAKTSLEELFIGEMLMTLDMAISIGPRLSFALRELDIRYTYIGIGNVMVDLKRLASQCPNLLSLKVALGSPLSNMENFVKALAPCKTLVHLTIESLVQKDDRIQPARPVARLPVAANVTSSGSVNSDQEERQPMLPNVKALSLFIITCGHRDYEKMNLAAFFPNVQVALIKQNRKACIDCPFQELDFRSQFSTLETIVTYKRNVLECIRRERASFRAFPKLTTLQSRMGQMFTDSFIGTFTLTRKNLDMAIENDENE